MATISSPSTKRRRITREDKKLALRIRELRVQAGLTQEGLAERLGLNISYVANVETYRRGTSLPVLYKITKVLNVHMSDLFPK